MFGAMKGTRQNIKFDAELLYVAALFHDLGLVDKYQTETKRFEVDGADAAREFLRRHGIADLKADLVWEAIALHTTPGIPQYMAAREKDRSPAERARIRMEYYFCEHRREMAKGENADQGQSEPQDGLHQPVG